MTLDKPHSLIANFQPLEGVLSLFGPESLKPWRKSNFARFEAVGIPTTRDEEFKYLSLRRLSEGEFQPAYGATVYRQDLDSHPICALDAYTLAFINGQFAPELSNTAGLPDSVALIDFEEAFETHASDMSLLGAIATLESKLGSTNDERFVWLNSAFLSEGAFLKIPKGVVVEKPIHLLFLNDADHGAFAAHPRVLILLGENAQAKVIETHLGLNDNPYFSNAVVEISVEAAAVLEHTKVQFEGSTAVHIANTYVHQHSNSTYTSSLATFGAAVSRSEINALVDGEHTETWLNGAYIGKGDQVHDNHTRIDHAKPNCHSFEVYKGILDHNSVGVFNGKIFVYEDAQKTDAKQTNQALLLSPTATINTKPQLEIFADDVKCTHGATIGQLRDDALFYLRARGIPESEARALLVYAFAAAAFERITIEPLRELLEEMLRARMK